MLKYIVQFLFLHFSILYGLFSSKFCFLSMCFSYLIVGFLEKVIWKERNRVMIMTKLPF